MPSLNNWSPAGWKAIQLCRLNRINQVDQATIQAVQRVEESTGPRKTSTGHDEGANPLGVQRGKLVARVNKAQATILSRATADLDAGFDAKAAFPHCFPGKRTNTGNVALSRTRQPALVP